MLIKGISKKYCIKKDSSGHEPLRMTKRRIACHFEPLGEESFVFL